MVYRGLTVFCSDFSDSDFFCSHVVFVCSMEESYFYSSVTYFSLIVIVLE